MPINTDNTNHYFTIGLGELQETKLSKDGSRVSYYDSATNMRWSVDRLDVSVLGEMVAVAQEILLEAEEGVSTMEGMEEYDNAAFLRSSVYSRWCADTFCTLCS